MSQRKRDKFYVVWEGRQPGVYASWHDAEAQIKEFPNAKFKSFLSREEAETAYRGKYWDYAGQNTTTSTKALDDLIRLGVNPAAVAVDAACSGVPGPMEYRGVRIGTGEQLFHLGPLEDGTNNVGEFLAVVHALALLDKRGEPDTPIYSDSRTARSWIRLGECKTKLDRNSRNEPIFHLIVRAEKWLRDHEVTNPILTWETEAWGEIPADFGRK